MIPSALDHVDDIAKRDRQLALFLDYDGTLTPIVRRPEEAVLSKSMRETVRQLSMRLPVAILSGRDLEDIRRQVEMDNIIYAGSHGFDISGPNGLRKEVGAEFLPMIDLAENELRQKIAAIPGALLERKRFSIAAHYRQASDDGAKAVRKAVNEVAACHRELRIMEGKKVFELQPQIDWNKGRASLWLLEQLSLDRQSLFPIYMGDDVTDEDAFRALRDRGAGIIVSEHPRQTAANYSLKDVSEVERFLREFAAAKCRASVPPAGKARRRATLQ